MDDLFEQGDDYQYDGEQLLGQDDEEIDQTEVWAVINKYFSNKGLVGQQVDSFDEFMRNTVQELIHDSGTISVVPHNQFIMGKEVGKVIPPRHH